MSDGRHMQWTYDLADEAIYNANGERIATVEPASGLLMAAAPDLLAACIRARETCDNEGDRETRDICDEAIAKAKGER